MKLIRTTLAGMVAAFFTIAAVLAFVAASLTGIGASFPAPIYANWADSYQKYTGVKANSQGIGSFGGVKQIVANTVDFSAFNVPTRDEQLNKDGLFQFPIIINVVVLAIKVPDVKSG